jgi:ABC-type multidrug transport system ATPase subunit
MAQLPLLSARDLTVRAGDRILLAGLGLDLAPGEVVALRGPSGAGKTTLLRSLALLQDPAAGELRLQGRPPAEVGWTAWRRQVCLVSQLPAIFPGSVGENLARPHSFRGVDGSFAPARARELLDRLLLDDVALDTAADRLSVGQQQRLVTARALLLAPPVLLLDEPTSALDPAAATALEDRVREAVDAAGAAALVVSHDATRADRWCDRSLDLSVWLPGAAA